MYRVFCCVLILLLQGWQINCVCNGTDATPDEFTSQVQIVYKTRTCQQGHYCSGTLISPIHVLTAAHCLLGEDKNDIQVVTGTINRCGAGGDYYDVDDMVINKNYVDGFVTYDIGIIQLSALVRTSAKVAIANLPQRELHSNVKLHIAGWGLKDTVNYPNVLQRVKAITLTARDCLKHDNGVTVKDRFDLFCTHGEEMYHGLSEGDSGSGLVLYDTVYGIATDSPHICGNGPDQFTSVFAHLNWILNESGLF